MNKKLVQIIVLVFVVFIWGKLGYDFFVYSQEKETPAYTFNDISEKPSVVPDDFEYELQLDYRDPFLNRSVSRKSTPKSNRKRRITPPKLPETLKTEILTPVKWPKIDYLGELSSTSGNQLSVILKVNGKEHLYSKGEVSNGVSLQEVYPDSILLSYLNDIKTILK